MDWTQLRGIVGDFIAAGHPRLGLAAFVVAIIGRASAVAIGAIASSALHWLGSPDA